MKLKILIISSLILFPLMAHADTQTGIIRSINCSSHSFGFDAPPLIRVYTNAATHFEGISCQDIKEGDRVEVEIRSTGPGTAIASKVKVLGHGEPVKDMASNEITIKLNQNFLMGVNQTAVLKEGGSLKIRTVEFINTLCKGGYECTGEGEVGMRMKVSSGGKEAEVLLSSQHGRKPANVVKAEVNGYTIQLIECGEDVVSLVVRKG